MDSGRDDQGTIFIGLVDCTRRHLCPDVEFRLKHPDMAAWVDTRRQNMVRILEHFASRDDAIMALCHETNAEDVCVLEGVADYRAFAARRSSSCDFPEEFPLSDYMRFFLKSGDALRSSPGAPDKIAETGLSVYGGSFLQGCVKASLLADLRMGKNVVVIKDASIGLGSVHGISEDAIIRVADTRGRLITLRSPEDAERFHDSVCEELRGMGVNVISTEQLLRHSPEFLINFFQPDGAPTRQKTSAAARGAETALAAG